MGALIAAYGQVHFSQVAKTLASQGYVRKAAGWIPGCVTWALPPPRGNGAGWGGGGGVGGGVGGRVGKGKNELVSDTNSFNFCLGAG